MRDQHQQTREGQRELPPKLGALFRSLHLVALAILISLAVAILKRQHDPDASALDRLHDRFAGAEATLRALHQQTTDDLHRLDRSSQASVVSMMEEFKRADARLFRNSALERATLLKELGARSETDRREVAASLRQELGKLNSDVMKLDKTVSAQRSVREKFQAIQQRWDPSVFLVHCQFTYRTKSEDGHQEDHQGSGWGTAFVVTADGHLVTNKHVVEPWKFDPEIAALSAMGEVQILKESVRLAAWRSGFRCMDDARNPAMEVGYNNGLLKNLEVVALAPDRLVNRSMSVAGTNLEYTIHELDNNDLAIIKLQGFGFLAVECAPIGSDSKVLRKLDQVMALGFPRGQRGLEAGVAETSPSLGTVRKIEDTIHITAPIIPGNSGGPVFNEDGKVVAIATRIYSETLGICLKIDHALSLLEQVRRKQAPVVSGSAAPSPAPTAPTPGTTTESSGN